MEYVLEPLNPVQIINMKLNALLIEGSNMYFILVDISDSHSHLSSVWVVDSNSLN